MAEILFINEADIKTYCAGAIDKNVDANFLVTQIFPAQRMYIKPFLGEVFYNDLYNNVSANTISVEYQNLLDNIKRPLSYYTVYNSMFALRARITQKGVVYLTDNNTERMDPSEFNSYKKEYKNLAEHELNIVKNFLDDNSDSYPLWCYKKKNNPFKFPYSFY